jgi:hypothetical protein
MPPVGFELVIPASERALNHALDRAVTKTGWVYLAKESLVSAHLRSRNIFMK